VTGYLDGLATRLDELAHGARPGSTRDRRRLASHVGPPTMDPALRPRPNGRRAVKREIRALVSEMATANSLWGAPRIHGDLRTLGVDVSERTL